MFLTLRGIMATDTKEKKKTKRPTAQKREITSEKKRLINRAFRSIVRSTVRSFEEAIEKKDAAAVKAQLADVYSMMDKAVKRGVYKLNKASRTKARLAARALTIA